MRLPITAPPSFPQTPFLKQKGLPHARQDNTFWEYYKTMDARHSLNSQEVSHATEAPVVFAGSDFGGAGRRPYQPKILTASQTWILALNGVE